MSTNLYSKSIEFSKKGDEEEEVFCGVYLFCDLGGLGILESGRNKALFTQKKRKKEWKEEVVWTEIEEEEKGGE